MTISSFRPRLRVHADGSLCLEGTRTLPRGFVACCPEFEARTASCAYDVRYEWTQGGWRIAIAEVAGGGGILIKHCPHCGVALSSLAS